MSTKTKVERSVDKEVQGNIVELKQVVSREYALSKAAHILLSNNIVSESKILEAYFLLVKEQRRGNLEYPVDYEFSFTALKLAKRLKRLREKK